VNPCARAKTPKRANPTPRPDVRTLIVFDGHAFFVRRVRTVEHDLERDEKVYRRDEPIGKNFPSLDDAVKAWKKAGLPT